MVVKVVGKDEAAVKKTTCKNCASILEYTLADTEVHVHRDYGGGSDSYRWLKCPACGNDMNLGSAY